MPIYFFKNKESGDITEVKLHIAELADFKTRHPEVEQVLGMPAIVSGVDGLRRTDDGFNDILKRIKSHHPKSTIQTR